MAQNLERLWSMNQAPHERPDLLVRMYSKQMKVLLQDLTKNGIMGPPKAWVDVFERQMRTLWHVHISLLTDGVVPSSNS